ncbi:MAG: hypothetical protein AB7D42_00935 [Candidatus Methanomethylophilaceae archaeon]|nr:arsenite transporter [Candidatus Methanomethylophilaceae archaeon]
MKYRSQPVFIILSALTGEVPGIYTDFGDRSSASIEPFLIAMLFFVFLFVDIKELKESLLSIEFISSAPIINFILTPIFAVVLGLGY